MSVVGAEDWEAMALSGTSRVLSTALQNKNFPQTCWMNFFPWLSRRGAVEDVFAYCFVAPYCTGVWGEVDFGDIVRGAERW